MSTTNPTEITTEWEELQIKYGNYAPRPPIITNEELSHAAIDFAEQQDVLANKTLKQLDKLEDDIDEDTLTEYRKQRLIELKNKQASYKYGEVYHINKSEYVAEVTEASKSGDYVILHMYKDSNPICVLINRALVILAKKHGYVKICKAIGTDVVQELPDHRMPTVLVYKNSKCIEQFVGGNVWGGIKLTPECIEWVLWKKKIFQTASEEDDPRLNTDKCNIYKKSKYHYNDNGDHNDTEESSADGEEKEINEDRRGYSSLLMEKTLRLK